MSIVLSGDGVVLRFPFPEEHEHLIANQHRVWFGDQAKISLEAGKAWLSARTNDNCILIIRFDEVLIGIIGWVRLDREPRTYEVGRFIIDLQTRTKGRNRRHTTSSLCRDNRSARPQPSVFGPESRYGIRQKSRQQDGSTAS
jgi:hypothetical protein